MQQSSSPGPYQLPRPGSKPLGTMKFLQPKPPVAGVMTASAIPSSSHWEDVAANLIADGTDTGGNGHTVNLSFFLSCPHGLFGLFSIENLSQPVPWKHGYSCFLELLPLTIQHCGFVSPFFYSMSFIIPELPIFRTCTHVQQSFICDQLLRSGPVYPAPLVEEIALSPLHGIISFTERLLHLHLDS